jgi:conjugative relaxase-like TrwC/TraI family protein
MLTLRKIRVASGDWPAARRAAEYLLASRESPEAVAREIDRLAARASSPEAERAPTAIWLGSTPMLAQLGVEPGKRLVVKELGRALQGREAKSGKRLRREGWIEKDLLDEHHRRVYDEQGRPCRIRVRGTRSVDLTLSAPKSVSVVWSVAAPPLRAEIEAAMLAAAEAMLENMTLAKPVVPHLGALRLPHGFAAAAALHVLARAARGAPVPAPQLHVHCLVVGVKRPDGLFAAPELWGMFSRGAPLEGGAVGRAKLAERLVELGFEIVQEDRYFEIAGVPPELIAQMSSRTREVTAATREREQEAGRELSNRERAAIALMTRMPKTDEALPARTVAEWAEVTARFGFTAQRVEALREGHGFAADLEQRSARVATAISGRRSPGRSPRSARASRAILLECAAGRLRLAEAMALADALPGAEESAAA